jgi:hypothetical protein
MKRNISASKTKSAQKRSDASTSALQFYLGIAKIFAEEVLEDEVFEKSGERYSESKYYRWSSNPTTIKVGDIRIKIRVPRLLNKKTNSFISLKRLSQIKHSALPTDKTLEKIQIARKAKDFRLIRKLTADTFGFSSLISDRCKQRTEEAIRKYK